MNSCNAQVHTLQAGQALAPGRLRRHILVVASGEVLFQPEAAWLAGTLLHPVPLRLAAPARIEIEGAPTLRALSRCVVVLDAPESLAQRAARALVRWLPSWRTHAA